MGNGQCEADNLNLVVNIILMHLGPRIRLTNPWAGLNEPLGPGPILSHTLLQHQISITSPWYLIIFKVDSDIIWNPPCLLLQHTPFQVSIQTKNISLIYSVRTLWLHETNPQFLPKKTDKSLDSVKSWEGRDRAGQRKDWIQRLEHHQDCFSVSSREALVAPGSCPQRATIRKEKVCVNLYCSSLKNPGKKLWCSNLDHVPISWSNPSGQGGSHIRWWLFPLTP